jgi:hypothetical protein
VTNPPDAGPPIAARKKCASVRQDCSASFDASALRLMGKLAGYQVDAAELHDANRH